MGTVHWWPGDGNTTDIVGGNDGTLQGGGGYHPNGKVVSAFMFDGVDDQVAIASMNVGNTFSLEFWIYPNGSASRQYVISNSATGSNFGSLQYGIGGYIYYYYNGTYLSTPGGSVPLNSWSHVALTYDGYLTRLYANGVLKATSSTPYLMTFNNALSFGYTVTGSSYSHFKGLLDEVTLYDRTLTVDEILAIYNAGSAGKSKY
jgi:hypothetical protein